METGDVCTLCPQNRQHPDCNSNKCVKKSKLPQQGAGLKNGPSDSGGDDDTHLSDSQLDSVQTTTTTGSSLHSSCSGSIMHDSGDYQWCLDYGYNREYHNIKKFPQSILSPAFERTEISSYDDVAKNIDANLAEIDMETFRSEDIHSILALPAIYSGDLQTSRHQGEKGASVSESLLGAFEIDSSVSPRSTSEDGSTSMSICKDEPLFSPIREQQIPPLGTISTDSLDCGSSFAEPDLVLTCRANKNNYTIAFEGSGPQFSDDSDYNYLEVEGSSGGDSGMWQDQGGGNTGSTGNVHKSNDPVKNRGDMIQSDCVFTTWSKLRRLKETSRSHGKKYKANNANKSQSLPNLLRQSVLMSEKASMESSWDSGKMHDSHAGMKKNVCLPLYDVQNSQLTRSKDSEGSSGGPVSLLKLFIQQRHSGSGSIDEGSSMCSSQSEASVSSHHQPSDCLITVISKEDDGKESNENKCKRETAANKLFTRNNIKDEEETNNNNALPSETVDNMNIQGARMVDFNGESEEDTSQCFEDSLMEAQVPRSKALQASVIKEEDEPAENSSSDETMQDMKDPFLSDSGTSEEATIAKNNTVKSLLKQSKKNDKMERITNVFSTGKSNQFLNIACCATMDDKLLPSKNLDLVPPIQTQGTQTKFVNQRMGRSKSPNSDIGMDSTESLPTSNALDADEPLSSLSEKVSPLPRGSNNVSPLANRKKSNVLIATTRTCGTQIPVHIKDQEVQTSIFEEPKSDSWVFTLKENIPKGELSDNFEDGAFDSPMERPGSPIPPEDCKDNEVDEIEKHESETTEENFEKTQAEKKIYVCYPNYSLPDLSFLRNLTQSPEHRDGPIVFTPSGRRTPMRQPAQRRSYSSEGRGNRGRPRSCNDFDTLAHHNFGHIRDWDSLKILLPEDIRNIISSMRKSDSSSGSTSCQSSHRKNAGSKCSQHSGNRSNSRQQTKRLLEGSPCSSLSSSSGSNCSNLSANMLKVVGPHFGVLKEIPPPIPKRSMSLPTCENGQPYPRSILRKSSSSGQCNNGNQGTLPSKCRSVPMMPWVEDAKSKRRSLQEPFHCLLDNIPESLITNSQHKQLLYNMESSRVQEGGEEQPAMEQFFQGQQNQQGSPGQGCLNSQQTHYKLCRVRSDDCCQNYNCNQNSKTSPIRESPIHQTSSTESEGDSTSDLQKLLVSSASLNYADALLSGQPISPLQSPSSNSGQPYSNDNSENDFQTCGCPRGKKVSFCEDVDIQGHHHHGHTSPCFNAKPTGSLSPCHCSSTDLVGEMIKNSCIRNMKEGLLKRLEVAISVVLDFVADSSNYEDKEECTFENVVLNNICPALYTLLADGLLPSVSGLFGLLQNSPWRLAENSCQQDPKIRELVELVTYINGDTSFSDNSTKFCGFVFGLLNLKMAEHWVAKFLCCSRLIQQNYQPTALVFLMSSLPSFLGWQHEVMAMLKPLAMLNFQLDLLTASNVVSSTTATIRASPIKRPPRCERPVSYGETERVERPYSGKLPGTSSWEGLDSVATPVDENRNIEHLFEKINDPAKSPVKDDESGEKETINGNPDWEIEDVDLPPKQMLPDELEGNAIGDDNPGFQQLRQKWEKMAGKTTKSPVRVISPTAPVVTPPSPAMAKPPLPSSHKTREVVRKPLPSPKTTTQSPNKKASPVHLRSKLPSPVRATTSPNRSRPQTPESPRHTPTAKTSASNHVVGKVAASANVRAPSPSQPKAIRKSMIPVHRPPTSRIPSATGGTKRQPVVARHPPPTSRFN